MPYSMGIPIMGLSINAIELPHAFAEIAIRRFDQQVAVIILQTVGMNQPIVVLDQLAQDFEKCNSVAIGYEYCFLPIAS